MYTDRWSKQAKKQASKKSEAQAAIDAEALIDIQALLSGQSWSADTVQSIAEVLNAAGYKVSDIN